MRRITFPFLFALLTLSACKKQVACDSADSQKVCEAFQQCLRSDTSTEVCKMGEQDANKIEKGKH
ncbi:MAG TPA: hypothetical protein VGR47_06795 [Terracidiphilus sp.]|nr:hypothetical protein [Terracidiphilus sp.]